MYIKEGIEQIFCTQSELPRFFAFGYRFHNDIIYQFLEN